MGIARFCAAQPFSWAYLAHVAEQLLWLRSRREIRPHTEAGERRREFSCLRPGTHVDMLKLAAGQASEPMGISSHAHEISPHARPSRSRQPLRRCPRGQSQSQGLWRD